MRRHLTMILSLSAVVWCALIGVDIQAAQWPEKPNVILILADDFGWTDTGFMGSRFYETPPSGSDGARRDEIHKRLLECAELRPHSRLFDDWVVHPQTWHFHGRFLGTRRTSPDEVNPDPQ